MSDFEALSKKGLQVFRGKEGWVKAVYVIVGIGLILTGGYFVAPYVAIALENILYTIALVVATFAAGYVVFSPTFQNAVIYFLDNLILKMENAVIVSDPFSTAQNAIKKLLKRKDEMKIYVTDLRGSRDKLKSDIALFEKERDEELRKGKYALEHGDPDSATMFAETAQSILNSINQLTPNLDRSNTLCTFIEKIYKKVSVKIEGAQKKLEIALRTFNINEYSSKAIRAAQNAMSGTDMDMFDRSMSVISDETFAMVGEIEFFMDTTRPLLEMDKITDAVQSEKALESLRQWMDTDTSIMNKDEKQQLLLESGNADLFISKNSVQGDTRQAVKVAVNTSAGKSDDISKKYGLD